MTNGRPRRNYKKLGRPTALTQETLEKLNTALTGGCTIEEACSYADVAESSYYQWQAWGKEDKEAGKDTEFTEFLEQIKHAQAKAKPRLIVLLHKHAEKDWRAALAILERRHPKEWGQRQYIETKDTTGQPEEVSDRELIERARQNPAAVALIEQAVSLMEPEGDPSTLGAGNQQRKVEKGQAPGAD